jgi:signal peptidase I
MEPTIREDSLIIGMRVAGKLEVGDIVVFEHNGLLLVKRIAGIPGDTVYSTDGNAMTVPSGCYYVLGDNTEASIDSRHWDEPFVTDKSIIAKVWTVH